MEEVPEVEEVPVEPKKKPRVRKDKFVPPPEPPPPLGAAFFGDLLHTQRLMEKERRIECLVHMRFA